MHDKYIEILPQISDIRVLEDMFKYSRVTLQGGVGQGNRFG